MGRAENGPVGKGRTLRSILPSGLLKFLPVVYVIQEKLVRVLFQFIKVTSRENKMRIYMYIYTHIYIYVYICRASLIAQLVKNLLAMQETLV